METVEGLGHSFAKGLNHFGHNFAPFVIEFMGAYFLVMTIGLTAPVGNPLAPLAIGSILMVMVFMGGHISGAHYNPAVTFGVLLAGRAKITFRSAFTYWFVQCLGGFLGALTAQGLNDAGSLASFTPRPLNDTHLGRAQAVFVEALYSFILATVVLNVATTKSQANNSFFGLGIGFTVVAAATAAGGLSGGVFNPAVGTGLTIVGSIYGGNTTQFLWIYWVGPMLGGAMSAVVFRVTNPKEYDLDFGVLPTTTTTQSPLLRERDNSKSYEMYH